MSTTQLEMHDKLKEKLNQFRETRNFQAREWIDKKATLFNEYLSKHGLSACVVSISGGIDSAVTMGLMLAASKQANSPIKKILGISQPIKSSAWALDRAKEASASMGFELITVDQTELHSTLTNIIDGALGVKGTDYATGQLRSYMRTPVNYYVAQVISSSMQLPCVVMGTGNFDEDGYLRYFCKAGDGICDVQLIADLHKSEVFTVGKELGVPKSILEAPPSADLWSGQTDEDELGFSYDFIELYTQYLMQSEKDKGEFKKEVGEEAWKQFEEIAQKADKIHRQNAHKAHFPVNLNILSTLAD